MAMNERIPKDVHVEDGEPVPWVGQHMSLDEFLALPEVKPYLEYEDGVVRQKMAPKFLHSSIQGVLYTLLNQVARSNRLGWARMELRLVTPGWAPVPDVSFYQRGRISRQALLSNDDIHVPPDIAVEIVSPSQSVTELITKSLRYLALGTTIALIVDPGQRAVLELRTDRPIQVFREDDRIDIADLLPDFRLSVRDLFDAIASDLDDDVDQDAQPTPADAESPASSNELPMAPLIGS